MSGAALEEILVGKDSRCAVQRVEVVRVLRDACLAFVSTGVLESERGHT